MTTKDVQSQQLDGGFKLTRVGVTRVKKPVNVKRPGQTVVLTATFDLFVDLPADLKGSHLSRNLEVLAQHLDESVREPVTSLEALGAKICRELLERHEYASRSEVSVGADYFLEKRADGGAGSLEPYKLRATATAHRNGPIYKSIGVEVIGMTACPCAMEEVRTRLQREHTEQAAFLEGQPVITHNQRNVSSLEISVANDHEVEANDLIEIVEMGVSSPTFEILKRRDEANVVMNAHRNPKFVEDVVRDILRQVLEKYSELPDDAGVRVRSESQESIHKHNAFAERDTTMGELRE